MPDNLKRRKPEDPTKINKNQDWELEYWANKLGVSKTKLKSAISKAGPNVSAVKKELNK